MRLDVVDLAYGYPGRLVSVGVSLTLEAGQVLCLLGPNGGGKTTLFKTILRLLAPRAGRIAVDGIVHLERADRAVQICVPSIGASAT